MRSDQRDGSTRVRPRLPHLSNVGPNVNISPRRGGWGNRVSPSLSGRGPEARAPGPRPLGGSGRAAPSQEEPFFILFVCGAAAWTAEVNMGEPGSPILPPAGGPGPHAGGWGTRFPHTPARRRAWPSRRGLGKPGFPIAPPGGRAWPSRRGLGKPGFPIPPPAGGPGPHAGGWGNPGSPYPRPQEGLALTQGAGETRVPHSPTRWESLALTQGAGETWFPPASHAWEDVGGRSPRARPFIPPRREATA